MENYYITEDKIADFVARMWNAGICVETDPKCGELTVKTNKGYSYIKVFSKGSFDELCQAFLPKEDIDEQEV